MRYRPWIAWVSGLISISILVATLIWSRWTAPSIPTGDSWEQRIEAAFPPTGCTPSADEPLDSASYQGPLIDAHFHPPHIPDGDPTQFEPRDPADRRTLLGVTTTFDEIACMFRSDGSTPRSILAFFPVFPETAAYDVLIAQRAVDHYPGLFVPFINPPNGDSSPGGSQTVDATTLDTMLSQVPSLFKGYGEIGLYQHSQQGPPPLAPDSARLQAIYPVLRKHGISRVFFHLAEGQQESFERALAANRDLTFIFHGDQLITQRPDGTQDLTRIDHILTNHPNAAYGVDELYGDVFLLSEHGSREEVLAHFADYTPLLAADASTWKPFIERHPDQVMWDTDRGTFQWAMDLEVGRALVRYTRAFIAQLDLSVQAKYAYQNAERILAN